MDTSSPSADTVGISMITALATTTIVLAATEKFAHPSIISTAASGLAKWTAIGAVATSIYVYRAKLVNWLKPLFTTLLHPHVTQEEIERLTKIELPQIRYPWDAYYDLCIKIEAWATTEPKKANISCIAFGTIAVIASVRMLYTLNHAWTTLFWASLALICIYSAAFIIDCQKTK